MPIELIAGGTLALARVGGIAVFLPWPGAKHTPPLAKAVFVFLITLLLAPVWPRFETQAGLEAAWCAALAGELLLGAAAGLVTAWIAETYGIAGQMLGLEAGFSYASSIDPASQADSTVLPALAQLGANLMFFALGLDRVLLRLLGESLTRCPPGACHPGASVLEAVASFGQHAFAAGARLALPVVALMLLADILLALVSRYSPQFQLAQAAFPAKILLALFSLALMTRVMLSGVETVAGEAFALLARLWTPGG